MSSTVDYLSNSDKAFKRAILLGFFIALGLLFIFTTIETRLLLFLLQIIAGGIFIGIIFNLSLMLLTSVLIRPLKKLTSFNLNREQLFAIVVWSHTPLLVGIGFGFRKILQIETEPKLVFWTLEILSLLVIPILLRKAISNDKH